MCISFRDCLRVPLTLQMLSQLLRRLHRHVTSGATKNGDVVPTSMAKTRHFGTTLLLALEQLEELVRIECADYPQLLLHVFSAARRFFCCTCIL
jgi:hypothetical protein